MTDTLKLSREEVLNRLGKLIEQEMHTVDDEKVHPTVRKDANDRMQLLMRTRELLEAQVG